jgi:hypothetical protein
LTLLLPSPFSFSSSDIDPDNGAKLGRWFKMANILDELENKDQQFWLDLLKKWLVDAPHVFLSLSLPSPSPLLPLPLSLIGRYLCRWRLS